MMDVETSNIDTGTEKPVFLPTVRVSASGLRVSFPLQYSGSFSGTVLIFSLRLRPVVLKQVETTLARH